MDIQREINAVKAARRDLIKAGLAWAVVIVGVVMVTKYGPALLIGDAGDKFRAHKYNGALRPTLDTALSWSGAGIILIGGIIASRATAGAATSMLDAQLGERRGGPVGLVVVMLGYILVLITFLQAGLGLHLQSLLVGGALAGVIIGIAAQQSLANFFAGVILLVVRPFNIGDDVVMRSGPLGGEYSGLVTGMSIFYVNLLTDNGNVALPNAVVLSAAIGPGARTPQPPPPMREEEPPEAASDRPTQETRRDP
jgi:small-conductance mechanosensitive channel